MLRLRQWFPGTLLAAAVSVAVGCADTNTGQDQRNGRGNGDQLPTSGPGSMGTNAAAKDVTVAGPGSRKVITDDSGAAPGVSTPYGGDGAGASPPLTPARGGRPSGDSNSGQLTGGQQKSMGSDVSTNSAKPEANLGGPGSGAPPK